MPMLKTTKTELAKKLSISRQNLYYKSKKPPLDEEDKNKIVAVMAKHPAYGARRVGWALRMNRKKTRRLMRKYGLKPKIRRGFRLVLIPPACPRRPRAGFGIIRQLPRDAGRDRILVAGEP